MELTANIASFSAQLRKFFDLVARNESRADWDARFDAMALDLFSLQWRTNDTYRSLSEARGMNPASTKCWQQVPAVPTSGFKELEVTSLAPQDRLRVFHSSGTTAQRPSRHFHSVESLELYDLSLLTWFECRLGLNFNASESVSSPGGRPMRMMFLVPTPAEAPHSSLVHMLETLRRKWGDRNSAFVGRLTSQATWTLDCEHALSLLERACADTGSFFVFGTAFSFVQLTDFLAKRSVRFRLPQGSRVMETGGYKGQSRAIPREQLHSAIREFLGVQEIIGEYGMCELSSQAYAIDPGSRNVESKEGFFRFPPWARVQIVSSETGKEVDEGQVGLIRIFDLANVYSVMAVQTEDLGVRRGSGFELVGRTSTAENRGCSLMAA